MSKNSDYITTKDRVKHMLSSLPETEEQAKSFFHTLDQGGKTYSNLRSGGLYNAINATYNLGINLPGALNNLGSLIYSGSLAYTKASDVNKDLVDPIFITLNEDEQSRNKLINTLSTVFKESKNQIKQNGDAVLLLKSKDQEISVLQDELNNYIKENKKDWQFYNKSKEIYNQALKEYEELEKKEVQIRDDFYYEKMDEDLSRIALKKEELSEIAMEYGQKTGTLQHLEDNINVYKDKLAKLQEDREKLTLNMGSISSTLVHYSDIAQDINDKDFLNAALTTPRYEFVFNTPQSDLKEHQINIKNQNGKIILESKLGHKTLELKGLSKELKEDLLKQELNTLSQHTTELENALKQNNFPGVLHHAYKNLETFIKMPADMDPEHPEMANARTEMVNGFVELLTQEHVKESLKPLAKEKLVDDIFELPQISPTVKEYHQLVKGMAHSEPEKFKELFGAILESKGFPQYINDLMNFIGSPSIPEIIDPKTGKKVLNENTAEFKLADKTYDKSMISLIEALEPNVIAKAIPLVNETLLQNIMDLPALKDLEKEEVINKAKENAKKINDQFLDIIKNLRHQELPVAYDVSIATEKEKNLQLAEAETTNLAFVEATEHSENLLAEPVKTLDEQIDIAKSKITELKANASKEDQKIYDKILKDLEKRDYKQLIKHQENLEKNLVNSFVRKLEKERNNTSQIKNTEISPIKKKLVESLYKIATNKQDSTKLKEALIDNKETLEKALDVIFNPKENTVISEVLKDFGVTAKEIVDLLPKICTQRGIKALAYVIEKPSITNTVNLLYQTNFLGQTIAHAAKGACTYAHKWVEKNFSSARNTLNQAVRGGK